MNHDNDTQIIKSLIGSFCERTIACNSIKLRFGCEISVKGTSYIWIDPPWEFRLNNKVITNAYDCPHFEEPDYKETFELWCSQFSPLNKAILSNAIFSSNGDLTLEFEHGYNLLVPYEEADPDEEEFYEHWYARNVS